MSAVSTFAKGNYPHQPCVASASPDCLRMLFSRLKIWRHGRDKTQYRVLSMKWFTSISVLIHIMFLVFHYCCLIDTDMDMESMFHKYNFMSSGRFQGNHIESNFLFVKTCALIAQLKYFRHTTIEEKWKEDLKIPFLTKCLFKSSIILINLCKLILVPLFCLSKVDMASNNIQNCIHLYAHFHVHEPCSNFKI